MKVRLGEIVESEFGRGRVVAMSKVWCVHEDEAGNEYAVTWDDVRIVAAAAFIESEIEELDFNKFNSEPTDGSGGTDGDQGSEAV